MRFFFLFQYMLHFDGWEGQFEVRRNITGGSLKVIQQPATLWRLLEGSVAQGTANTLVPYYQSKSGDEEKVLSWYCHGNLVAYLLFWGVPLRTKGSTNGGMLGYRAEIQCCQLVSQENMLMHGSHAGSGDHGPLFPAAGISQSIGSMRAVYLHMREGEEKGEYALRLRRALFL